jgi:hypothetical protein
MYINWEVNETRGEGEANHRFRGYPMLRRLSVILFTALALAFGLSTAATAGPPITNEVTHEHQLVENFQDTLPTCEPGELYNVTTTTNLVFKETTFANGTMHATFTQTGKVSAAPADSTGPTYTGQVTIWGGFNQNNQSATGTSTFSVSLKGSDGSRISTQQVEHFSQRPDGSVHEFFKCQ